MLYTTARVDVIKLPRKLSAFLKGSYDLCGFGTNAESILEIEVFGIIEVRIGNLQKIVGRGDSRWAKKTNFLEIGNGLV